MLRVVKARDPKRQPDVVVAPSAPSGAPPFASTVPSSDELVHSAELILEQFDEPTENTPITAVSLWQRMAPPPLPQSEDG